MSGSNYNQPPPYAGPAQSSYPTVPSGNATDPRLPLYHEHHYHYHRYKPSSSTSNRAGAATISVRVQPEEHVLADARAVDRFWSAVFIGFFVWLAIVTFTDGLEVLRLAVIGLAGALKAILDYILRELRLAGWDV